MDTTHAAANHGGKDSSARDQGDVSKEIAALKSGFARLSQLLLQEGTDVTGDAARQISNAGKGALAGTETKIRDWPLLSVLLAFLVGLVFGRLVLRK